MSISFTLEQSFNAPPEKVFAAIADLEQAPRWMPNVRQIEKVTPGPFGAGTQFRETRTMFGRDATEVFEVTAFDPPRSLELKVDGSKGSSKKGEYRFRYDFTAPDPSHTNMTLKGEVSGMGIIGKLLGPLLSIPFKKAIAKDHAALKAYLEKPTA